MKCVLIGQKNVGKSSLFNKILGKNANIVHTTIGSTRDFIEREISLDNKIINLIDTPGINPLYKNNYDKNIISYIKKDFLLNNKILFIVSAQTNSLNIDSEILRFLRKINNNITLIINKTDNPKIKTDCYHFSKLGIKEIFYTSCTHNNGIKKLKEYLFNGYSISKNTINNNIKNELSIGVYGKPNVGKSTFVNSFIGFNRFQTGTKPGITTDSVSFSKNFKDKNIIIYDTAGIRPKRKIIDSLEITSSNISIKNISNTLINLLIIDSTYGLDRQDKRIIKMIIEKGIFLLIIFNKIDLVDNKKEVKENLIKQIYQEVYQAKNIKYFFISALKKTYVKKIFEFICNEIPLNIKLSTSKLNNWLKIVSKKNSHPLIKGKKINFKYCVQLKSSPITIKIFTNYPSLIIESYKRYLKNDFIKKFKIKNQNINIIFTKSENPYVN